MDRIDMLLAKGKYFHKEEAAMCTKTLIPEFGHLNTSIQPYIFNNGFTSELVCIKGTIPVVYMRSTYHIPVEIWLLPRFPYEAPLVFVRPTAQMTINPSETVDPNGFVKLQYLSDWSIGRSDLITLVHIMQHQFAEQSPVYSVANVLNSLSASIPTNGTGASATTPNLIEPMFVSDVTPRSASFSNVSPSRSRPSSSNSVSTAQPLAASAHPRLPPIGVQAVQQPQLESQLPYPILPPGPYPVFPVAQPSRPNSSTPRRLSPLGTPGLWSESSTTIFSIQSESLDSEHLKASLVSAIIDKANRVVSASLAQFSAEYQSLLATQAEISQNGTLLDGMIYRLQQEIDQSSSALEQLRSRTKQLEELSKSDYRVQPEDIISPTAPVYKQLTEAYAEEQALEDAMHYLDEALQREAIKLDVYVKHIRQTARKQFNAKLTVRKCREMARLPVS